MLSPPRWKAVGLPLSLGQARNLFSTASRRKYIDIDEFNIHFQACMPVQGWHDKIAVAFSGGPDSTCLLYLLSQLTARNKSSGAFPSTVVAVTIDHSLQPASSQMTEQCVVLANSLKVKHSVYKIPWGTAPFPSLPSKSSAFENVARQARYHLLLAAMRHEGIATIAFGHHADDQVETALLRIARGSSEMGAAGMRPCRRWGMGFGAGTENLGWAGQHGMDRWIVRPLLRMPKERLLATCREAGLEYVEDPTNFQPGVTDRNRIRYSLRGIDENRASDKSVAGTLETERKTLLNMAARIVASTNDPLPSSRSQPDADTSVALLRSAVQVLSQYVDDIEDRVSNELANCIRPSPTSTVLLSEDALQRVTDSSVRLGMVRRVLRCVSPFPWGSPEAEAGRRTTSLQRISDTLWSTKERILQFRRQESFRKKLVAGAGVLWTPVGITRNGKPQFSPAAGIDREYAWLASRQPPIRQSKVGDVGSGAFGAGAKPNPVELDITSMILSALQHNTEGAVELLYDCRFLLRIKACLLPLHVINALSQADVRCTRPRDSAVKVLVVPHTIYFLPKIVLRRTDAHLLVPSESQDAELARLLPDGSTHFLMDENNKDATLTARDRCVVRIDWVRELDADVPFTRLQTFSP